MQNHNTHLNDGNTHGEIKEVGLQGNNSTRQPENTGPTDNGHLPALLHYRVIAKKHDGAAVILALREHKHGPVSRLIFSREEVA